MAELATAWVNVALSARGIESKLRKEIGEPAVRAGRDSGERAGKSFAERFEAHTGESLSSFGTKALIGAAALGTGLYKVASAAGDLEAAIAANEQILGDASIAVQEFAETGVESVGLSERAVLDAATSFGQLGKILGLTGDDLSEFATDYVTMAADLAAFANVSPEKALQDLQAAFRGSTETMANYNIFLNETELKQALFNATGEKVTGTLTAQQRVLATHTAILEKGADIWGQAERESGSFERAQANLKGTLEETAAEIGANVLPQVTSFIDLAGRGIGAIGSFNDATGGLVGTFLLVGTAGLGTIGAMAKIGSAFSTAGRRFQSFGRLTKSSLTIGSVAMTAFALNAAHSAREAEQYADALSDLAGVADEELGQRFVESLVAGAFAGDDMTEALQKIATQSPGTIERVLELEDASGLLTSTLIAEGESAEDAAALLDLMRGALDEQDRSQKQAAETAGFAADSADQFALSTEDAAEEVEGLNTVAASSIEVLSNQDRAFQEAEAAADDFNGALERLVGGQLGLQAEQDAWLAQLDELQEVIDETAKGTEGYSTSLDETTEAGRKNREMMRQAASQALSTADAMLENGASTDEAADAVLGMRDQLIDQAAAFFGSREEAEAYINQLGLTPESVETAIYTTGVEAAKRQVQSQLDKLDDLPEHVATSLQARIDEGYYADALRRLRDLTQPRFVDIYGRYQTSTGRLTQGGGPVAVAEGGYFDRQMWGTWAEDGPEAVLPLTRPWRMQELLSDPRILRPVMQALPIEPVSSRSSASLPPVTIHNYRTSAGEAEIARAVRMAAL